MNRRGFLGTILALGVAPAVVRASRLMPIRVLEAPRILVVPAGWADGIDIEALIRADLAQVFARAVDAAFVGDWPDTPPLVRLAPSTIVLSQSNFRPIIET